MKSVNDRCPHSYNPNPCFLLKSTLSHINLAVCHSHSCCPLASLHCSHSWQLSFVLFHLIHYWQLFCVCVECLCVCFLASPFVLVRLSASCHIMTCFFVVVVHFSLITTLFCFISLGTLLATFLCLCWVFMCVFSCISLHLGEASCIMSCHDLFLCCCCSFLTHHNSLLFYFIRYIIGNFFVYVLSVYVSVFLCLSASWQSFLHLVTSQPVSLLMLFISHSSQLSFVLFH